MSGVGRLTLVHTRTLKLADEVMCVRYSRTKDPDKCVFGVIEFVVCKTGFVCVCVSCGARGRCVRL